MSTTLQYMDVSGAKSQETAPAISHYKFHRVHGAQIDVISGTRRNPVLIRRKPIESCSAIRKDRSLPHILDKVQLLLTGRKPVF